MFFNQLQIQYIITSTGTVGNSKTGEFFVIWFVQRFVRVRDKSDNNTHASM